MVFFLNTILYVEVTLCSTVSDRVTVAQLHKKFPIFYGTQTINTYCRSLPLDLYSKPNEASLHLFSPLPIPGSLRTLFNVVCPCMLRSSKMSHPFNFLTKHSYTFLIPHVTCPYHFMAFLLEALLKCSRWVWF